MTFLKLLKISFADYRVAHREVFWSQKIRVLALGFFVFTCLFFSGHTALAATLPTLSPVTPDGTATALQYSTGGTAWSLIDDDPDSPVTSDWIANDTNETNASIDLNLTDMPSNFSSMDTLSIDVYINAPSNGGNDTVTLTAQVFQSNGSTQLTNVTGTLATDGSTAGKYTASFTGVTASDKTTWDGALLRLSWAYSKAQGPDNEYIPVAAVELDGTYTATSYTYSGTLYSDEGNTPITTGKTIKMAIGTSTPSVHTTTSDGSGNWSIVITDTTNIGSAEEILVWVDGDTVKASRLYLTSAASGVTGLHLYQNRVILDSGVANISNTLIAFYDGDDDSDIQYTSNAGALVVNAGNELHINTGKTFIPGGSVTINGNAGSGVDGSFHLADGATYTAGATTTIAGNLSASSSATWSAGSSPVIFNATTTGKTIDTSIANLGFVTFNGSGGEWSFSQSIATTSTLTITNGTLTAPTDTLVVLGSFTQNGLFTDNGGTVKILSSVDRTLSGTMNTATTDFNHLILDGVGTKTFSNNASTTNFTINSGATVVAPANLSISGNYTNNGTFTANSGTTTINGTANQTLSGTLSGSSAFSNIEILNNSATTTFGAAATVSGHFKATQPNTQLAFQSNATTTFNTMNVVGTSGNEITLRSTTDGQAHTFYVTGAYTLDYLDIKDSYACPSGTVNTNGSIDSTGNTCWNFAEPAVDIVLSGTLYSDEGVTPITTGKTIAFAIGTSTPSLHNTTSNGSGAWTFTVNTNAIKSGTPVVVWVDGDSAKATLFTKASSTSNNIPNLDLYQNRVIISHEATSGTSTANANLAFYDGDDDADIQFTSNAGTLSVRAGNELHVKTGKTFAPGGAVTINGNAGSGVDGSFHLADLAVYTAGGNTTIAGNLSASSSATWTPGAFTTTFTATTTGKTIDTTFSNLGDVAFNGSGGAWSFSQANATTSDFTITNGTLTAPSGVLAITGNYTQNGSFTDNSGTVYLNSASAQAIAGTMNTSATDFYNLSFFGAGTKTFSNNASTTNFTINSGATVVAPANLTIAGNYTQNGSFTHNNGTVHFNSSSGQLLDGTMNTTATDFYNLIVSGAGVKIFLDNASTTNLINQSSGGITAPPSLTISGDYTTSGDFNHNNGTLHFDSNSPQNISGSIIYSNEDLGSVTFSGTGVKTFSNDALIRNNFHINSGASVVAPTSLSLTGNFTNNGSFDANGGTVQFGGTSAQTIAGTMTTSATDFTNLLFSGAGTKTFSNNASTTGNFTIQSGSGAVTAPSVLTIGGNYSNSSTFTHGSGLVHFNSGSAQGISGTLTGTSAFNNVNFVGAGTKTFSNNASTTDFIINSGATVVAPANLTIAGDYTNSGSFTDSNGTVNFNGGSAQDINGTMTTSATDFSKLIFSGAGTKTFSNNGSTSAFTINSGATVVAPTALSVIGGDFRNDGTFTNNSGVVYFDSSFLSQNISGTLTGSSAFHAITIDGVGAYFQDNASTTNITIKAGSELGAPPALTIAGDYTNNGFFFDFNGTVNFNGGSAQTIAGTMTTSATDFSNLIFSGAGTKTFSNNASTTGDFTIQSGSGAVTAPSVLTIAGDYSNSSTFTHGSGLIHFDSASAQAIAGTLTGTSEFNNLIFSGAGTKTFSNNASTNGSFTIQSGATVSAPTTLTIDGDYTNNGDFTANSGTVAFAGASQTIAGEMTGTADDFNNVSFSGSGTKTFSNNASTTNFTINSGATVVAPANLTISGNYSNSGSFTDSSGTVNFNGSSAQAIAGTMNTSATDFYNLIFFGAGTKTFSNNASTTNFTTHFSSGTVVMPGVFTIAGNFYHNDTLFDSNSGTVYFDSDSAQSIDAWASLSLSNAFADVVFNGTGAKTIVVPFETNDITIESGASLSINNALYINGNYTNNGTFSHNNNDIGFKGTSPQVVAGTLNFGNVAFYNSGTKTFSNNASTTNFTINSGSGAVTAPTSLSIAGNYSNASTFTNGGGTIHLTGTSKTLSGTLTGGSAFNDLSILGSYTASNNASTSGLTIQSGGTFTAPTLLSIAGDYSNSGTFTAGSGTTTLNGTSAQTLSGSMTGSNAFAGLRIANTSGAGSSTQSVTFSDNASTTGTFTMNASTSVEFNVGGSYTFENIYLNGASGQYAWLRSTSPGTQYDFHVPGNQSLINYVNVQDSDACAEAIIAENGTNVDAGNNTCWSFVSGAMPTISSAANQNFVVGQATTTISTITITDTVVPNITAANDIRIIIATTTVDMKWDTTDTEATFGGTASAKASTTVSYSANGDTLIIDVTENFAGSDTLTISGLSFAQFNSFAAPANALGVRVEGVGTTTNNTDDKTISISGGLTLSGHSAGLPSNGLDSGGSSGSVVPLYTFRLQGVGESVDIDSIVFRLTGVINILTDDLTNLLLYRDTNSDKAYDGGDVVVGGSGTPSISGGNGTITFGTTFTADTTARDYLLIGDYEKVLSGETMTIALDTGDISATGVTSSGTITPTGSADSMTHYRGGQSQGGGRSGEVGGGPPPGDGVQGGGDDAGGGGEVGVDPDTGESLGNELGFEAPSSNSGSWANGGNAYASDGSYASSTAIAQSHVYGTFGFTVPSNNEITGIEVKFEAHDSDTAGDIDVVLSWNNGMSGSFTTAKNTGTLTATDAVYSLGGPGDDWGHTWVPAEGDDGKFIVRFTSRNDATIGIDAIQVRIYHQTSSSTVGGGGGGGEVSIPNNQFFANVFSALHNLNPFTQILLFVSLMSLSIAFIAYLRARSRKGIFIDPNQCDDG